MRSELCVKVVNIICIQEGSLKIDCT